MGEYLNLMLRAGDIEQKLLHTDSVYDCLAYPRRLAQENSRDQERIVAYVVPAASVPSRKIPEWIESLRWEIAPADYDLIAISQMPLTGAGEIDCEALERLPFLDSEMAGLWEKRLKTVPGVRDAVVVLGMDQAPGPPLHFSDLFGEPPRHRDLDGTSAVRPVWAPQGEGPPSISHGSELLWPEQAPHTLGEALRRAAQENPDRGVTTIGADRVERFRSYPSLLSAALGLAGGLRQAGLQPGDPVLLQIVHNDDFFVAFWACVLGGFVPVPLAPAQSYEDSNSAVSKLLNAWKMLGSPMVLSSDELAAGIRALGVSREMPGWRVESLSELAGTGTSVEAHPSVPGDPALIMLTSGSTGAAKGVVLSHSNLLARSVASVQLNGFTNQEVTLNWMPLDHVAGIVYFHLRDVLLGCSQIHGATSLVLEDPLTWIDWIDRYRATTTFAPNFAYALVNDREPEMAERSRRAPRAWDLSCLRRALNGAEAIVPRTARRFLQLLGRFGLSPSAMWPVWGMSETSSGTTYSERFTLESTGDGDAFVEVGRPIPGFSLRIVDDKEQIVPERTIGSLQVRGATVTAGYFRRPDLNAEAFTADGWFKTGDLGFLRDGRLTITGRDKEVIVINSVNYYCHEIESVVEEIDAVETSYTASIAVRDAHTDTDRLAIFFHPSGETIAEELIRTIRRRVSQRLGVSPDYILPVEREAIPKTNIGKIQRTQLARAFHEGRFADVVKRVEILSGSANTVPDWFFQPCWRPAKLRPGRDIGATLVFTDSAGLGQILRRKIVDAGYECVLVSKGAGFFDGNELTIDPGNAGHYRRALDTLAHRGFKSRSIVHLWTYGSAAESASLEELEKRQETGLFSVMRLAQALMMQAGPRDPMLFLAAGNDLNHFHEQTKTRPRFEHAAILGMLKSISQESPGLICRHVDLRLANPEENAQRIFEELQSHSRDQEALYRAGTRYVRRLDRVKMASEDLSPLPIAPGGLYLLSGGLGGIGSELAKYLLQEFKAHVILAGRSALDSARTGVLRSLQDLAATTGGTVTYESFDIGDPQAVERVVRQAEAHCGRVLAGIFHLAGVYRERPILNETPEDVADLLHPKLRGTWALNELLKDRPGTLFVSFSSVNGFFGGFGVGAYSSANAVLDSFSEYQRKFLGANAYCIAWSLWDGVGMSRGFTGKEAARGRGFQAISPRQGLLSLLALLRRPPGFTLVGLDGSNLHIRKLAQESELAAQAFAGYVAGDRKAASDPFRLEIRDRYGVPVACEVRLAPAEAENGTGFLDRERVRSLHIRGNVNAVEAEGDLEKTIARIWSEILNVNRIGVTDNFFELGGTSLILAQAARRMDEILNRKISMTEMFRYPTVRLLAAHLSNANGAAEAPEMDRSENRGGNRGETRREMIRRTRRRHA